MLPLEERIGLADRIAWERLPLPGRGDTAARHLALLEIGRTDLSLARLAEAHTDALAIIAEAGRAARAQALYGVWASDSPGAALTAERHADGGWQLDGIKPYCSGALLADAALVSARDGDAVRLFDVALDQPGIAARESTWATPALADTDTRTVAFTRVRVDEERVLGDDNWYLTRPGFWHGAIGPAACWAGGAASLLDAAAALNRKDPHARAHLGAMQAIGWGMSALLEASGREIDADPRDARQQARVRALKLRHLIERWCSELLDRFGRATGPQLLAHDARCARQHMALTLYIRQCHAERDLATIPA